MADTPAQRPPRRIVLIDDSDAVRRALRTALEKDGYVVLDAASGEAGLKLVLTSAPDVLITDYELPGINGMGVIHRVRSHPSVQSIPCILLTGADAAPPEARGLEGGADVYIRKTTPLEMIVARVGALVRRPPSTVIAPPAAANGGGEARQVLALIPPPRPIELELVLKGLRHQGLDLEVVSAEPAAAPDLAGAECVLLAQGEGTRAAITAVRVRQPGTPVLVLALADDPQSAVEALHAGADDFVSLDGGLEVIASRIRAHLRRRRSEDQQARLREEALRRELADTEARAQRALAETRAELLAEVERKNAELTQLNADLATSLREVKARDDQFRTVARCVPGVVYLVRHDTARSPLFLSVAVESLTGFRAPDFVDGKLAWSEIVHPDDRDRVVARIDSAIAQRKPFEATYRLRHASGAWRWVEERGRAIFDEDEVRCIGGTIFDVTERLEAEEELERFRQRQRPAPPRP